MTDLNRSPLTDPPLRTPGQSLVQQYNELLDDRVVVAVILPITLTCLAAMEWIRYFSAIPPFPWLLTFLAAGAIGWFAWRLSRTLPQLRQLRLAISGERAVGQFLEALREKGYRVFHDVLAEDFNVDHVLIGPAGIFTVETKTRTKPRRGKAQIIFDGEGITVLGIAPDRDPLVQARAQARWVGALLSESTGRTFSVRPVVVFPGWYIDRKPTATRDLWVLEPKALPHFLDQEPTRLGPEDIAMASTHLSRLVRASERTRQAIT